MTGTRERKGKEADRDNRVHGRCCSLLSALGFQQGVGPPLEDLGYEHSEPQVLSPNLPPLCHRLFLPNFFFTPPSECRPKARSGQEKPKT